MMRFFLRGAFVAAMTAAAGGVGAAPATSISLGDATERASLIETRRSAGDGAAVSLMNTRYYASGEMQFSWDGQQVLTLCEGAVYLKFPEGRTVALTAEQRQMFAYQAMLASLAAITAVGAASGESLAVAADGSELRSAGESPWAYGVERFEVTTQRMPGGAIRVRSRKTETVNTTPPASPDDRFSTEDDQAARLSELAPVGSWTEVVVHEGPRLPQVDPAMSLKEWTSMGDDRAATVAEARKLHECK
ncbi:hypothetical protein [Stenotrophomonas maltophilia]|uniref:hypothetical protein n=1 Tax=Stenotrophomonas maltophilia TaxID=40324 RepID=UPI0021C742AF|nr:hypothetical protein [Stenotrophomonas maltophilia]MCU1067741.1 hypothetical protein [Stenotrophomonas maltophilia]MCU1074604.1 hypothetical protein [Stenotrophomonas maltophilia]MCU1140154.1 hypothetical protein [Stenotrophomonas maltophilia]